MNQKILDKLFDHFANCETKLYKKGEIIVFANQNPKGIFWLNEGLVEQYDITPEGNRVIVNIFKPLAFFPMSWAINKTENTYFYAALTDVELKIGDADKAVAFLQANPDVLFDLLSRVYKGTDALLRRLVLAASGIAASRLVYELLIEAYRFGQKVDAEKHLVTIKQNALAARSGLARETVSRELHKLVASDSISLSKEGIIINTKKLEQKLDFNL